MEAIPLLAQWMLAAGLGYLFTSLYLLRQSAPVPKEPQSLPRVAVLVAMRNEEANIADCLQSLEAQSYPAHRYDVYVIDDQSSDNSVETASPFIRRNNHFHLKSINEKRYGLDGKMNALAQVLKTVDQDWILITDADCIVPPSWIRAYCGYMYEDAGMVGALTLLHPPPTLPQLETSGGPFARLQALDWLYLQTMASASSHAGKPLAVLGNNFAFRLRAYRELGGFAAIGFSVTEDFALMRAMQARTNWRIVHSPDAAHTIYSRPLPSISAFMRQRQRWVIGGRGLHPWGYFLIGLSVFTKLLLTAVFLSAQWHISAALGIGLVLGIDYFILKKELRRFKQVRLLRWFVAWEGFQIVYFIYFAIVALLPLRVSWKGRRFK